MTIKIKHRYCLWLLVVAVATMIACNRGNDATEEKKTDETARVFTLSVETENAVPVTSKEKYVNCSVTVNGEGVYAGYHGSARIRGRGNSSWLWYDKKPYRIKLDEKAEMLGLGANKDWVLLANYRDPTHLMNAVAFEAARFMELPHVNHSRYLEVTLNGDYIGLYQLTEQVEADENRVEIDEEQGYLLSLDLDDGPSLNPEGEDNFWSQVFEMPVCVKNPEDQTPQQLNVIKENLAALENAVNSCNYEAVEQLMDIKSFINFLILQEFVYNVELAAPRSMYMYKDKGGKYFMGPPWDFDGGYDFDWSTMYTGHNYFTSYRELVLGTDPARQKGGYKVPAFFTQMFKNATFVAQYKAQWNGMHAGLLAHTTECIDKVAGYAAAAMERDYVRWHIDRHYQTEIARLKLWIQNRTEYLTTVINNIPAE
jgi:spore coat protein CotH